MPKSIKPKYHFYNIPVTTRKGHSDNIIEMLKAVAKVDDYVVIKLDIDEAKVELEIVKQLLSDPSVLALVDEFYFEHHANVSPKKPAAECVFEGNVNRCDQVLLGCWAGSGNRRLLMMERLTDTYRIFSRMRHQGVLAHAWV